MLFLSAVRKHNSIWNKEELPEEWMESIIVPNDNKGDKTDCSNYRGISRFSTTYKILTKILLLWLATYAGFWGSSMWISKQQVSYCSFHSSNKLVKNENAIRQCISHLQTSRNPMIQLGELSCLIISMSFFSP